MKINVKSLGVYVLSLFVMCLWGMSLIWTDRLKPFGIPPEYFLTFRILLAGLLLLAFNYLTGRSMKIRSWKDFRLFLLVSLFEPLIYFLAETYGLFLVDSPSISSLVLGLNPVLALFFGLIFFGEKINAINVVGLVMTLCGLAFVVWQGVTPGGGYLLGILILLVAVIAEVSYASLTKRLATGGLSHACDKDSYSPSVIVMYQFLIGSVYMVPLFLTRGLEGFNADVYFSWDVLYPLLSLALLCSCLCFSLWAFCIKHLGVAKSGNFIAITPVFTALLCWLLGRETLSLHQWIGIAIAIVGLVLTQHSGGLRLPHRFRLRIRYLR